MQKPWVVEALKVAEDCVNFGFHVDNKSLKFMLMQELDLNHRFPTERGQSIRDETLDSFKNYLQKNNYALRGGVWRAQPQSLVLGTATAFPILRRLSQLPDRIQPKDFWAELRNYGRGEPEVSCDNDLSEIKKIIPGQNLIEIGPGFRGLVKQAFRFGANSYTGVDPYYPSGAWHIIEELEKQGKIKKGQAREVESDGLSFLLQQPDNSASIISFYVLGKEMLPPATVGCCFESAEMVNKLSLIARRYWEELGRQIVRVVPVGGFVYHGGGYDSDPWDKRYADLGLKQHEWRGGLFFKK